MQTKLAEKIKRGSLLLLSMSLAVTVSAQTPPSLADLASYTGLLKAVVEADPGEISQLLEAGADINAPDSHGRTPLMLATYSGNESIAGLLIARGADVNALDIQRYDMLTIAAVANDVALVRFAIGAGADTAAVTSPYDGTALIAAAHLGHVEVVSVLVEAGAPLDHINNIKWTALIEAIVLGDGGTRHQSVVRTLIEAGADVDLADGAAVTPLTLARLHGHREIEHILLQAGARP